MVDEQESTSRFTEEDQHGWSPDVGSGGSDRATEANRKAFEAPASETGPGREASEEERSGVPPTDTEARSPLGVGESTTTRAEDQGPDEEQTTLGTKGASNRPYGTTETPSGSQDD